MCSEMPRGITRCVAVSRQVTHTELTIPGHIPTVNIGPRPNPHPPSGRGVVSHSSFTLKLHAEKRLVQRRAGNLGD